MRAENEGRFFAIQDGGGPGGCRFYPKRQGLHFAIESTYRQGEQRHVPMAEKQLSEAKLAELLKGFERIEEQKIGVGKHEEFHKMIDQLESAYLK